MIGKIKLDLFKLKSKEDLESVYQFFKKILENGLMIIKTLKRNFFI
jgi:hypothetical protein